MCALPIFLIAAALLAGAGSSTAQPEKWRRTGNRLVLPAAEGRAELEWVTPAAFRFVRDWTALAAEPGPAGEEAVDFEVSGAGSSLVVNSRLLRVHIRSEGLLLRIDDSGGRPLLEQLSGPRRVPGGASVEQAVQAKEMFFGLGPAHRSETLDLRGRAISTSRPFLISSAGYGLYFAQTPGAAFDLAKTDEGRLRIHLEGGRVEMYFYYGPGPKEILEQHLAVSRPPAGWQRGELGVLPRTAVPRYAVSLEDSSPPSAGSIRLAMLGMLHAAFSAQPAPVFDLGRFEEAPQNIWSQARQLAPFAPLVAGQGRDRAWLTAERRRLRPFLEAYFQEMVDRGFPIIRPLPMQYPKDPEAAQAADQFLFGDELLVAPVPGRAFRRMVYLPMGIWTDLRTNARHSGRRRIEVESAGEPLVFAKNGALAPFLRPDDVIEAHYFPRSGGEFFVYEPEVGDYTQLHASPAGDLYRLEIETKATRHYEWVVHHLGPVRAVVGDGAPLRQAADRKQLADHTWFYDRAAQNLHIRVPASAGSDIIHYVAFHQARRHAPGQEAGSRGWDAPAILKTGAGLEIGRALLDFACIPAASVLQ